MYVNYGTGVVISDRWVLSAAHVTGNNEPTGFQLEGQQRIYGIRNVRLHEPNSLTDSDIRLVEFPAGTFDSWSKLAEPISDNAFFTGAVVGYGQVGVQVSASHGWEPVPGSAFSQKRVGTNLFKFHAYEGHQPHTFTSDFDPVTFDGFDSLGDGPAMDDLECVTMGGDSGGPTFILQSGEWRVIGIHFSNLPSPFFSGQNYGYGSRSIDWNIQWFLDQIDALL